jgi:hypothetical protein
MRCLMQEPNMHNCAFCKNPIKPLSDWKGSDGRFYCSEFCAEANESIEPEVAVKQPDTASTAGASQ